MNNQIIAYWGIGSGDNPNRNIGWVEPSGGWTAFVETWVKPGIDLGITRWQLHNPAGTETGQPMQADQFVLAKEQGLDWVIEDFVKAWRPITEQPGIEVIAYLGMFYEGLLERQESPKRKDAFMQRLVDSYRYPVDAGMSIGFDALHQQPASSEAATWMRFLQSMEVKTYIEPWPYIGSQHLWDCHHMSTLWLYNHMTRVDGSWAAPRDQLTGEPIIILSQPIDGETWATYHEWAPKWCREMNSQGFTISTALNDMIQWREPLEKWLAREP